MPPSHMIGIEFLQSVFVIEERFLPVTSVMGMPDGLVAWTDVGL